MKTIINHTFNFGKIAANGKRRENLAEIELRLEERELGIELSICGNVWNRTHTDIIMGGQCLDSMRRYLAGDALFMRLYGLWKNYHLNGMHAGTAKQEAIIDNWLKEQGMTYNYKAVCALLKSEGVYTDTLAENEHTETAKSGEAYVYGSAWVHRDIPSAVIEEIYELCGEGRQAAAA